MVMVKVEMEMEMERNVLSFFLLASHIHRQLDHHDRRYRLTAPAWWGPIHLAQSMYALYHLFCQFHRQLLGRRASHRLSRNLPDAGYVCSVHR